MTRAVLYARISQDDAGTEKGIGRQLEDARQHAAARGWTVVGEYSDNDVSAYNGAVRKGYREVMAHAEARACDRIVCYHTSRLWRSRRERAEAIEVLCLARVSVAAIKGPELDLTSASGRFTAGVLGEFDTMESEVKGERVARAAEQRAQEGRANGAVAYGWRREHDLDAAGRITGFRDVENPDESNVVREIVDRVLAGDGIRKIADDLNSRGVPVPSRREGVLWRHSTIGKLAIRPANVALRVAHGAIIGPAAWPAIVDRDKHDRVAAILTAPERKQRRIAARRHLLTYGVGECGVCGSVLRVANRTSGGRRYELYVCEAKGCVGRSVEKVDNLVSAVVIGRLSRPDAADLLVSDDGAARTAREQAEAIRARLNVAADQYAEEAIDAEQLSRITAKLRPQLAESEETLRRLAAPVASAALGNLVTNDAADVWTTLDVARRRQVLEVLGLSIRIMPTRQGPGFDPESVRIEWRTT